MLVFEILERQAQVPDDQAAEYFFKDLRGLNDPSDSDISKEDADVSLFQRCRSVNGSWDIISSLPRFVASMDGFKNDDVGDGNEIEFEVGAYGCIGQHRVRMSPSSLFAFVKVELCVLRLKHVRTDFLITLSQPMPQEEYLRMQQQQCRSGDESCEVSYDALSDSFKSILESFVILDWNLFG